jgi:8-amino-7-oxononanoate synthase
MDGDRAPLEDLAAAAALHDAVLIVDEAHALGVVGPLGSGLAAQNRVIPHVTVGTLGKAFAAFGGFAAGSLALRSILTNRARQFIYTTACPPAVAAAALAALKLATSNHGTTLRTRALSLASAFRQGLKHLGINARGDDLIVPVVLCDDRQAMEASAALLERGILVPAIRPPTVPAGTSRLRVTISAAHSIDDVDRLVSALAAIRSTLTPAIEAC